MGAADEAWGKEGINVDLKPWTDVLDDSSFIEWVETKKKAVSGASTAEF